MPTVEFEVWCSCGAGLCNNSSEVRGGIFVEPCEKCIENAKEESKDEGYSEGYKEGYDKGYDDGYNDGYDEKCKNE